jgi:hypothetical protein
MAGSVEQLEHSVIAQAPRNELIWSALYFQCHTTGFLCLGTTRWSMECSSIVFLEIMTCSMDSLWDSQLIHVHFTARQTNRKWLKKLSMLCYRISGDCRQLFRLFDAHQSFSKREWRVQWIAHNILHRLVSVSFTSKRTRGEDASGTSIAVVQIELLIFWVNIFSLGRMCSKISVQSWCVCRFFIDKCRWQELINCEAKRNQGTPYCLTVSEYVRLLYSLSIGSHMVTNRMARRILVTNCVVAASHRWSAVYFSEIHVTYG